MTERWAERLLEASPDALWLLGTGRVDPLRQRASRRPPRPRRQQPHRRVDLRRGRRARTSRPRDASRRHAGGPPGQGQRRGVHRATRRVAQVDPGQLGALPRRRRQRPRLPAPADRVHRAARAARPAQRARVRARVGPGDRPCRQLALRRRRRPQHVVERAVPHLRARSRTPSPPRSTRSSPAGTPTTPPGCRPRWCGASRTARRTLRGTDLHPGRGGAVDPHPGRGGATLRRRGHRPAGHDPGRHRPAPRRRGDPAGPAQAPAVQRHRGGGQPLHHPGRRAGPGRSRPVVRRRLAQPGHLEP